MDVKIIGFENGPLKLDCDEDIIYQDGQTLSSDKPAYLCRCGSSKKKPFCDGSHAKSGFSSKQEIKEEVLQSYKGKELSVNFNRSICAGASECVKGLPSVFKTQDESNWIFPDEATKDQLIKTLNRCPSGALSYTIEKKTCIDKRSEAKVSIIKNGPYAVEGIIIEDMPTPTNFAASKYTLCRCGFSNNKPYCDYSHAQNSWKDED